jgi:Ca2+-binding EF-hand superfamily protein
MRLIRQGIVSVLLGVLPALAFAGTESTAVSDSSFTKLDADQSGTLSRTELQAYPKLEKSFDTADADTNGELSPAEFSALIAKSKEGQM